MRDGVPASTLFDQSDRMLTESRAKADRAGFFLSHLTEDHERVLFDAFRIMLNACGRFLILDSAWSQERARYNTKEECQSRRLNDGTAFEIYKRYCDRDDISRWVREYRVTLRVEHFGSAFYAVSGAFD